MKRFIMLAILAFILTGCTEESGGEPVNDENDQSNTEEKAEGTEPKEDSESDSSENKQDNLPEYEIVQEDINEAGIYNVTFSTDSKNKDELEALARHSASLANEKEQEVESIFYSITQTGKPDLNMATGKLALTDKGLAQTGLESTDEIEFKFIPENTEEPKEIVESEDPITADDVISSFKENDLSIPEERDNTNAQCSDLGCSQLITTETVSIYQWPTEEKAKEVFGKNFGDYQSGTFILRFNEEVDQEPYKNSLDSLVK